jgi:hypothetical protein
MGDFDRNEKPAEGSQSKKLAMVGVLGIVLLVVVGMQMVKRGPSAAAAASNTASLVATATDESPEILRATLLRDPTQTLLTTERATAAQPRLPNPFRMSASWRKSITRDVVVVVPQQPTTKPADVIVPTPVPQTVTPLALKASDYKLNVILNQNGNQTAVVNGVILTKGQYIKDALVVDVRADAVVLRHKDFADGPRLELLLHPN